MNTIDIRDELTQNFIDFSYEANSQRAFPDARDGLKPGQRACLWEMHKRGYSSNKPHVKSAKISGGVIANWWPHGDVAIYETFARMSQPWINNIPEVNWHGNNGNIIIGSAPASARYTEARLSKATEDGLFYGIKKNNVPMVPNFSEDDEWPEVLPAIMPRLLLNGSQGIGVTIANSWLNYNLKEVSEGIIEYLKTNKIDVDKIRPDFPTGGVIINSKETVNINKTGKGKAIVRAKTDIDGNIIKITELPYQVFAEPLIGSIRELIEKDEIDTIKDIRNKTDKKGLLIEIECSSNPAGVLKKLFQKTELQKTFNANQWALVGKTPQLLTLEDYVKIYVEHNIECIKKEYEFDLDKALKRKEIVEGLLKALTDIDNIIALIKQSESAAAAKDNLIQTYNFTDSQSKAIVEMKLGRLANLEQIELQDELKELVDKCNECNAMINNVQNQKDELVNRIESFVNKYGVDRKTTLMDISVTPEEKEIEDVVPEDCVVVTTQSGLIKRVPKNSFKSQNRNGKGVKNQDGVILSTISTNTVDTLMFFTDYGKMYRLIADDVPVGTNASKGTPLHDLIKLDTNESVVAVTSLNRKTKPEFVVFITKNGLVKKSKLEEYINVKRSTGIVAIKLKENDSIARVTFLDKEELVLITHNGTGIHFETENINPIGRTASGVKSIKLADDDYVIAALPVHKLTDYIGLFMENGSGKKIKIDELPVQGRTGKGLAVSKYPIAAAAMIDDNDMMLLTGKNSICISAKDVPLQGRAGMGNIMIKDSSIKNGVKI